MKSLFLDCLQLYSHNFATHYAVLIELLNISIKFRLYYHLLKMSTTVLAILRHLVVELPLSSLAADCPLLKHLGFNHMPYTIFFLLSQHSHPHHLRCHVVVIVSLGCSSNSMDFLYSFRNIGSNYSHMSR
nr:MAG TPA: hypothetical protein [Caudoviricetes sp.]